MKIVLCIQHILTCSLTYFRTVPIQICRYIGKVNRPWMKYIHSLTSRPNQTLNFLFHLCYTHWRTCDQRINVVIFAWNSIIFVRFDSMRCCCYWPAVWMSPQNLFFPFKSHHYSIAMRQCWLKEHLFNSDSAQWANIRLHLFAYNMDTWSVFYGTVNQLQLQLFAQAK